MFLQIERGERSFLGECIASRNRYKKNKDQSFADYYVSENPTIYSTDFVANIGTINAGFFPK
jgi:hypothetical protein